jgi:hypothetical protein
VLVQSESGGQGRFELLGFQLVSSGDWLWGPWLLRFGARGVDGAVATRSVVSTEAEHIDQGWGRLAGGGPPFHLYALID